jgi:hypothetical protein
MGDRDDKKPSTFLRVKADLEAAVLACKTHGELKLAVIARLESDEATGEVFGRKGETSRQRLMRLSGLTRDATFKAALKGVVELGLMAPSQRVYSRGDQRSARYWRRTEAWASSTQSVPDDDRTVLPAYGTPSVPDEGTMSVPDEGTLSVPDLYKDTATLTATETAKGGATTQDDPRGAPSPCIQTGPFPKRVHGAVDSIGQHPSPIAGAPSRPTSDQFGNSDLTGRDYAGNLIPYRVDKGADEKKRGGAGPVSRDRFGKLEFVNGVGTEFANELRRDFPGIDLRVVLDRASAKINARTPVDQWPGIIRTYASYVKEDAQKQQRRPGPSYGNRGGRILD